jgi:hypothetical protein
MRYLGLVLIPLLVVFIFAGPGCQQSQDEPKVQMEQAVEEPAVVPMMEKAPAAMEEVEDEPLIVEEEDVVVEEEEPVGEAAKEGSGLLKQLKEKGEEEAQKKADEYEVEKKIDDLGM